MRLRRLPSEAGGVKSVWGRGECVVVFSCFWGSVRLELDQINQEYIEEGALVISADSALRL